MTMSPRFVLQIGLGIWVLWHAAFGLLSTFAPETGGALVGWRPSGGWDAELHAMSKQYGMVMLLLAGVYLLMMVDPVRYIDFIWVAIGEQALGIAYGAYIYAVIGQLTTTQLVLQVATNTVLIVGMIVLWRVIRRSEITATA